MSSVVLTKIVCQQFNPARIGDLASYPSLCMGLGNFLFVPLSLAFGRRPLFIFCSALMVPAVIWAAKSTSFNSHLGARCLQGLIAGVADCLLPLIVLDVTFLHRRGFWMGLYWSATSLVTCLMLVCVPFLVHNNGENWRLNYWFWLGWAVLALILAIFGLRETLFYRETAVINGQLVICDAYGQVRFEHAAEGQAEEVQPQPAQVEYKEESFGKSLLQVGYRSPNSHFKTFLNAYVDLFICLTNPAIFWTLLLNSILFAGLVILSLTYEQALESPPWLFSAEAVGTAQIGSAIGSAAAFLLTGTVVERTAEALARRNGGVREPEHLLPSFAIPVILAFLGLVVYGVVGAHPFTMSWVGVHAGFALYYCGFIAISALSSMWIAELTPKRAGPAIVLICGGRNAASFGIRYVIRFPLLFLSLSKTYSLTFQFPTVTHSLLGSQTWASKTLTSHSVPSS